MSWLKAHRMLALFLLSSLAFTFFSRIDLLVSAQFYQPGSGFLWRQQPLLLFLYELVPVMVSILIPALVLPLLAGLVIDQPWLRRRRKAFAYLLMSLILGPGLIVNAVFKDNWGRARPVDIREFGGTKAFTAALVPSDQCRRNCAFVSGHPSMGFYFLSLGFLIKRQRRFWLLFGVSFGGLIGLARIVQGRHYLSDVVFSFFVVYASAWLAYELLFRRPGIRAQQRPQCQRPESSNQASDDELALEIEPDRVPLKTTAPLASIRTDRSANRLH